MGKPCATMDNLRESILNGKKSVFTKPEVFDFISFLWIVLHRAPLISPAKKQLVLPGKKIRNKAVFSLKTTVSLRRFL